MIATIIKFGLLGGLLVVGLVFLIAFVFERELVSIENGELFGYAGMIIALTMVFFGIRAFRTRNGSVTIWQGLQVGFGITFIAAVMYFLGGEFYNLLFPDFGPTFMAKYADYQVELLRTRGAAEVEIEAMRQQMANFIEMYKNPLVRFGVALIEFVPVGIIVTLICSLLLRGESRKTREAL